ncbi:MAG: DUF4349 domain-containing protein [Fuerstiella sp.]
MKTAFLTATLSLFSIAILGCGASDSHSSDYESFTDSAPPRASITNNFQESTELHLASSTPTELPQSNSSSKQPSTTQSSPKALGKIDPARKIIYTANLNLTVESFSGVENSILNLGQQFGGFVARANISGRTGDSRQGSWTLRIPTEQYRAFLSSAGDLGEIISLNEQTKEVTAEFHDVDARIRNKQKEEQRLNKILEERPGKLDDVLTVEREVSRVREEIERMQGRLRVLRDLTSYSTVSITVTEIQHYAPPATPTFAMLIERQWESTVASMTSTFQSGVLWAIAVGPWLVIIGLVGSTWLFVSRRLSIKPSNERV